MKYEASMQMRLNQGSQNINERQFGLILSENPNGMWNVKCVFIFGLFEANRLLASSQQNNFDDELLRHHSIKLEAMTPDAVNLS